MSLLPRFMYTILLLGLASSLHARPQLNGMAVHNQLAEDQFIAAVFSETPTSDARSLLLNNENKVMEIRVLTDTLYARRFKRMWIEGIAINAGPTELEKHAQHLADFSNLLRIKMRAGDILRIERIADTGTLISINGYELGVIPSEPFFDLLLRTWIGPVPLSTNFKQGILAGGEVTDELQQRYERTSPSPTRIAAVTAALQAAAQAKPPGEDESESPAESTDVASTTTSEARTEDRSTDQRTDEKPAIAEGPAPKPKQPEPAAPVVKDEGLPTEDVLFADDSMFDDEDEDFAFTAEGLLSEQVYIAKLTKWTSGFVKYPRSALRSNQQGTVRITVTIRRNGTVKDVHYLEKSEHEHLNRAATKAVKSASPYPAVPDTVKGDIFMFTVPVVFRLQ